MIKNVLVCVFIILGIYGCGSVEKFNAQLVKSHDLSDLKEDVDYAYRKLKRLHPDLYWYISKEDMDRKIDSLKQSFTTPLTSKEFYVKLAPVIANIRQGHISMGVPLSKNKEEFKVKGERESPFSAFELQSTDDKLYVIQEYKRDTIGIAGSEILAVDEVKVAKLLVDFRKLHSSDGYNTTFISQFVGNRFGSFYTNVYPQKDSILLDLRKGDSLYSKYIYPRYSKVNYTKEIDSTSKTEKKLTKLEKQLAKEEAKKVAAKKSKYGFDYKTSLFNRNLEFLKSNDSTVFAYMNIKSFGIGKYKEFYTESFEKIDSAKCKNLVLDVRGNYGGRLTEIEFLYSYLADKEYVFIEKAKMTKRFNFLYPLFYSKSKIAKTLGVVFSPVFAVYQMFKVKKKDGNAYFKFKQSKTREPQPNAYKGKVYVLIDGKSFSASSIISTNLKATKRATFVGEETGGAYNGTVAGLYAKVELPNSKVRLNFGLMKINSPYTTNPDGYGVKPDVVIEKTLNDEDEELSWILEDINKSEKK